MSPNVTTDQSIEPPIYGPAVGVPPHGEHNRLLTTAEAADDIVQPSDNVAGICARPPLPGRPPAYSEGTIHYSW
ncbi:hypothetical protein GCM10010339_78380 [Streptomyces alanosinicus]|uniref:Uncharacterized protein n=1 Tax=Streptomyces alanosinicus TaxID=68171 RepID=A0A918YS09_9ACTN|nr:hypothetical protein GCM10010339_78380 [Streptomyces alanosinicus]